MRSFPSEIQTKVLQFLDKSDLRTCFLVCRSWYSLTVPVFWTEVKIDSVGIGFLNEQFKKHTFRQSFRHGHVINKLVFDDINKSSRPALNLERNVFTKHQFLLLLRQLVNLTEIDIVNSCQKAVYLMYLLDASLPHIEKIIIGDDTNNFQNVYFSVCYKFRASITHLNLRHFRKTKDDESFDVINALKEFKHLETLEFYNGSGHDLSPVQILKKCPNLKDLSFITIHSPNEETFQNLSNDEISLQFPMTLARLQLQLPALTNSYIQHFINNIPNHLDTLFIQIQKQSLSDWIASVGIEKALQLLDKLNTFRNGSIHFKFSAPHEITFEKSGLTSFFKLLQGFKGSKSIICNLNFEKFNRNEESVYSFQNNLGNNLYGKCTFYKNQKSSQNFRNNQYPIYQEYEVTPPEESESLYPAETHAYQCLYYALAYCTDLEHFHLNQKSFSDYGYNFNTFDPSIYYEREKILGPNKSTRDINYLQMGYVVSTKNFFFLINTYLPNIERFIFKGDDGLDRIINLTGFKKLKRFTYHIKNFYGKFLILFIINGENQYFWYKSFDNQVVSTDYDKNFPSPCLTLYFDESVAIDFVHDNEAVEIIY